LNVAVVRRISCDVTGVLAHGASVYTVELRPSLPVPRFKPGQFLHLALDEYQPGGFWPESRVFSIASSPLERDRLVITYSVKGSFTGRMQRELAVGRRVWVKLPYGEFVVDPSNDAVLFAGGTGVTAFTAFLRSLRPANGAHVLLCYGARTPDLFVYRDLAAECAASVPSFDCRLLCEQTDGPLSVAAVWDRIAEFHHPVFYLSGPPQMLAALSEQLCARGVRPESIRTDAWE
jgi:ferredoxin-NADP reductase